MIITREKPFDEILKSLEGEGRVFLVGCGGCAEGAETGGEPQVLAMRAKLEEAGKEIMGWLVVDFLCNKVLVGIKLIRHINELAKADSLLILSCGVGVQAVSSTVDKVTHPALDTISMGGFQGMWRSNERCYECGECILDITGGLCPLTLCTKGLLNGPCGGSDKGKCEVAPERDCGWSLIYERLNKLDQLDKLREFAEAKDYSKLIPSTELRTTTMWALEKQGEVKESATR